MIKEFNLFTSPKEHDEEKCDEERNQFLCDSLLERKKYSTFNDSL
jgi:hypothetical protein